MIYHYICLSSSYTTGKRIAIDISREGEMEIDKLVEIIEKLNESFDGATISTHTITTESHEWSSVVEKDVFYKDVEVIDDVSDFLNLIQKDCQINALDVAKYICSKHSCTHLKLQKLLYLCYADYLCYTKNRLFEDTIYAFKCGPVIESVYETLKGNGRAKIETDKIELKIKKDSSMRLPTRSKIMFSNDGVEKIVSIDKTLEKYSSLDETRLINLTHKTNTPWSMTDKTQSYSVISNDLIIKYHSFE